MHLNASRDLRFVNFRSVRVEHPRRRDRSRSLRVRASFLLGADEYRGRTSVGSVEFSDGRSFPGVVLIAIAMREILDLRSGGCSFVPFRDRDSISESASCARISSSSNADDIQHSRRDIYRGASTEILRDGASGRSTQLKVAAWDIEIFRHDTFWIFNEPSRKIALPPIYLFGRFSRANANVTSVIQRLPHRGALKERQEMDRYDGFVEGRYTGGAVWDTSAMTLFKFPLLVSPRLLHPFRSNSAIAIIDLRCPVVLVVSLSNPRSFLRLLVRRASRVSRGNVEKRWQMEGGWPGRMTDSSRRTIRSGLAWDVDIFRHDTFQISFTCSGYRISCLESAELKNGRSLQC